MMKKITPVLISLFVMATTINCSQNRMTSTATPREGSVTSLNVEQFHQALEQEQPLLIDVRTQAEFAAGHLPSAINIYVNQPGFGNNPAFDSGKKAQTIAVYCRSGKRSLKAANILSEKGFRVYNLDGGILAWQQSGKPTTK